MIDIASIKARYEAIRGSLNERQRRLFAANEARSAGRGGVAAVAEATGMARSTIGRGLWDLADGEPLPVDRSRRAGGGKKPATVTQPGLLAALERLVQPSTLGEPETALRWISKSREHLSEELGRLGFRAGKTLVGKLLGRLGFSLQGNAKTREGASHPDRDAQFRYINTQVQAFQAEGQPTLSVDTKKKENVGDFKNPGRELRPRGNPEPVQVHDFPDPVLGKAVPYGIYDIGANHGWVNVGISHDTAEFAVQSIRAWWQEVGAIRYPGSTRLLITADCGGSNGNRLHLWKHELQLLADELGIAITVCHHPPGTSKWNRIEHKLFSFISLNWRGKPLISYLVIVQLIAATRTAAGLTVAARLDEGIYQKGIKVPAEEIASLNIQRHEFHGEWNYTIQPRQS